MRKFRKRLTALTLSLSCCIALCSPANATTYYESTQEDGYICYDYSNEYYISSDEADRYSCFEVSKEETSVVNDVSTKEYVLSQSELVTDYFVSETEIKVYESPNLQKSLYECNQIVEVTLIDGILYITYFTDGGIEVHLGYNDEGLTEKVVYYPEIDTAIIQNMGVTMRCDGFRAGCSSEISDELMSQIERYIEDEDWNALDGLGCIDWENETSDIEAASRGSAARASGVFGFTSDAAMLDNLKSDFTIRNDMSIYDQYKYTSILAKSNRVKVLEDRNGYVRKSSDWKSFAASTAVSVISTYLSVKTSGVVTILDALGISMTLVDGVKQIMESVTLYRSAKYRYLGARDGYVWDDTLYNNFVHVIYHSGYGEFTGGYSSSGVFTWVESIRSAAYDFSADSIATKALENYAKNVYADGHCSMYAPD